MITRKSKPHPAVKKRKKRRVILTTSEREFGKLYNKMLNGKLPNTKITLTLE